MLFIMALYLYVHYTLLCADQFVYSGMLILNNWVKLFEVTYDSITVYSTVFIGCYYVYRCFHWLLLWIQMFSVVVTIYTDVFIGCYYGFISFHWLLLWIQMFSLVVTMGTFVFHWLTFTTCNSFFLHVLMIHLKVLGIINLLFILTCIIFKGCISVFLAL